VSSTDYPTPCKYVIVNNVYLYIHFQDKYYSQKFKPPTHYKPTKQQYKKHPPHVEHTLPNQNGIVPRDAVWQKVQSTKYCDNLKSIFSMLTLICLYYQIGTNFSFIQHTWI